MKFANHRPAGLLLAALLLTSCGSGSQSAKKDKGTPGNRDSTLVKNAGGFKLSWSPAGPVSKSSGPVTSYHIFYTKALQTKTGGNEIDSIDKTTGNLAAPSINLDKSNIDPYPARGSKVCFYIVANNQNLRSEPSDSVCGTID